MFLRLSYAVVTCVVAVFFHSPQGFAKSCGSIQTTQDLYECTLENHPDFKSSLLQKEAAGASRDKITQLPNPELTVKSVSAAPAGEKVGGTEFTLTISLTDLLIKRAALYKSGRAEERAMTVEAQEQEFKAKSSVLRDLFRYRQILNEYDVTTEAIGAFEKIERMYRGRRARGPEQDITLNLVQLAQGDYQLRKSHLLVEKAEIEARFKGILGANFEIKKSLLPPLKKSWPDLNREVISKDTFELRRLAAEKERTEAEKSLANIESWPRVAAGPVSERVTEGLNQYTQYGFTVTVGLPLLSFNGGSRALASKKMLQSQIQYDFAASKATLERDLLIQKYSSATEALKRSTSDESLRIKHAQVDEYFRRGLSASTTVIEAHRQITEFTFSQHEHEIMALESLLYLNILSGKDPSEVLK